VNFATSRTTRLFWSHVGHLRVRGYDREGRAVRVLSVESCAGCRRLWGALQPVAGTGFPARQAVGPAGLYIRLLGYELGVEVRAAREAGPHEVGAERAGSPAVRRLNEFTQERARRARLEHY